FVILKAFNVKIHPPNTPKIKEILWHPPLTSWTKCNSDGAAHGSPGNAACGGVFRDYQANFLGCYAFNIGVTYALLVELMGAILAIEIAFEKGWHRLWLEIDSQLVTLAFKQHHIISWTLHN
ncbi:ribonuclease H protein, partial [Trifolium medium]|nr:ribonuclease H protein [Trifolium medium]